MTKPFRRAVAALLALTLVAGLVPHGVYAAEVGVTTVMSATGDMPIPGMCDGCSSDHKSMTSAACAAHCASLVALPAIGVVFETVSAGLRGEFSPPHVAGHTIPPNPHPPKPVLN